MRWLECPRKAVVFDCAGTLVDDGSQSPVEALRRVFSEVGLDVTEDQLRQPMGSAKRHHIATLLAQPLLREQWLSRWSTAPDDDAIDRLHQRLETLLVQEAGERSQPLPGILEVLHQLRRWEVPIGITTGYTRATLSAVLAKATGYGLFVDATVTSDEVPQGRPAPWMLFRVMEALGAYPPRHVIKVGDTPLDMAEARNAGAWAVGVLLGGNELGMPSATWKALPLETRAAEIQRARQGLYGAGAHMVLDEIAQLPSWLEQLTV